MKYLSKILFLAFFISTSLFFSACSSSKSDPAPTTGTISGQVQPVTSVTTVTATSASNQTFTATPSSTGAYSIGSLVAGTYTLSFTPAAGYSAPATQSLTVTAGNTTTATAVTLTQGGSGTWSVSGVSNTATLVTGTLQFNNLSIILANATGTSVVMNMDGFYNALASFPLGGFANSSQIIFGTTTAGVGQQWTTAALAGGGSGTITVTAIGASPRRVSGTFSCTATPATSASTGTKVLTGSFSNIPY